MLCDIELKKVEIDHSFYFVKGRFFCPFCKERSTHKTKKYDSLKSLEYHISREHQTDRTTQFTIVEIRALMKAKALAMQIGLEECRQSSIHKPSMYPKVKRFFDVSF